MKMGHRKNLRLCNFTLKAREANVTAPPNPWRSSGCAGYSPLWVTNVTYIRLSEERSKAS
jgi:hypothetical protein